MPVPHGRPVSASQIVMSQLLRTPAFAGRGQTRSPFVGNGWKRTIIEWVTVEYLRHPKSFNGSGRSKRRRATLTNGL